MARKRWLLIVAVAALGVSAPRSRIGPGDLVKDLNASAVPPFSQTTVVDWAELDDTMFFLVWSTRQGEIWRTDGTPEGTAVILSLGHDVYPGDLTVLDRTLFFVVYEPPRGSSIWRSDGTPEGTVSIREALPETADTVFWLTPFRGSLFFSVYHSTTGRHELWRSDGSIEGTLPVLDLPSFPLGLTVVGDRLFFAVRDNETTYSLYVTDGTRAGTRGIRSFAGVYLRQVCPGSCPLTGPTPLVGLGGRLFFVGTDTATGAEPWMSDGTPAGTYLLRDIYPGPLESRIRPLGIVGDVLYFHAEDEQHGAELWRTDGTPQGTTLVRDINPGMPASDPTEGLVLGNALIFRARTEQDGPQLWRTDGTSEGTRRVLEGGFQTAADPLEFVAVGGAALFSAVDGTHGRELWRTDGTAGGTFRLADILPGEVGSNPRRIAPFRNQVLFVASGEGNVSSLWRSDGSSGGTEAVHRLESPGSEIRILDGSDSGVFAVVRPLGGSPWDLWRSDGSESGTVRMTDPPLLPPFLGGAEDIGIGLDDAFLFQASDEAGGRELWRADLTGSRAMLVRDLTPGPHSSYPVRFGRLGPWALFRAWGPEELGDELYRTDGTAAGTTLVKDVHPGPSGSAPSQPISFRGLGFFSADDGTHGRELWKTDGTDAGTGLVKDIRPGAADSVSSYLATTSSLILPLCSYLDGCEIWKSDGTEAGTVLVLRMDRNIRNVIPLLTAGDLVYFMTADDRLWRTDGTELGTFAIRDRGPVAAYPGSGSFAGLGRQMLFAASDAARGTELWVTDGTAAGTRLLVDIRAGYPSSSPRALTSVGGVVLFSANDGVTGWELWRTDGTPSGTWRVADIWTGAGSSSPAEFRLSGSRVFFSADDGESGNELWSIELSELFSRRPERPAPRSLPFRP